MKPLYPVAVALTLALGGVAQAAQPQAAADSANTADAAGSQSSQSANEAAGLPDLKAINRPAAEVTSKVDINVPRTPSFYERSPNGTTVTEYRDRGKPVEVDVHSNFGTHYQMSAPLDTSPTVHDSGHASTRLPSLSLSY
jgi:hypothetical protein